MAIKYGFFNSVNSDRKYNADDFNAFFNGILSDTGVMKKSGNGLKITAGDGMTVNLTTGRARINQHFVAVTAPINIELSGSSLTLNRYDAICLRMTASERKIEYAVIEGTPASTAVKPSIIRTDDITDVCLAYVYIPSGSSAVASGDIEDTRDDTALCGFLELDVDAVDVGLVEYRSNASVSSSTASLNPGIAQYDSANDILDVYVNGFKMIKGVDYTESGTGTGTQVAFTNTLTNARVEFRVIKAVVEITEP